MTTIYGNFHKMKSGIDRRNFSIPTPTPFMKISTKDVLAYGAVSMRCYSCLCHVLRIELVKFRPPDDLRHLVTSALDSDWDAHIPCVCVEVDETRLEERGGLAFIGANRAFRGMERSDTFGVAIGGTCSELVVTSEVPARED